MIEPVKKKLNIVFLATMVCLIFTILLSVYLFMDYRLTKSVREHLVESIETEFMPHYRRGDFDVLSKIIEDELFEVLDGGGNVVFSVKSSILFSPGMNRPLFDAARRGQRVFEIIDEQRNHYFVSYYPLGEGYIGRAVHPIEARTVFRKNFTVLLLFALPLLALLAYFSSRYMVNQSLKPISNVMKYQETFSSNISHELKSPLTSIKGNLEVALRRDRSPREYRGFVRSTLNKMNEVIDLLNNLTLISSSEFMPLQPYFERVNMDELIEEVVGTHEPFLYAKNVTLTMPVQEKGSVQTAGHCMCDASLMRRAIDNLVDNAVKYTQPEGTIDLRYGIDTHSFLFTISNTCPDIDNDEMSRFFEPFFRGKNGRDTIEGRGLGLHVVQHIVLSHGGTLTPRIENETFSITFNIPNVVRENSKQKNATSGAR